jgi:hypothetical protein
MWAVILQSVDLSTGIAPKDNFVSQTPQGDGAFLDKTRRANRKPQVFQADLQGCVNGIQLDIDDLGVHGDSLKEPQADSRAISCW